MDAGELRNFTPDELGARVKQWKDDLFRSKLKAQGQEARDTSVIRKLRRDIARALTVLNEKKSGKVIEASPIVEDRAPEAKPSAKAKTATKAGAKKKKA